MRSSRVVDEMRSSRVRMRSAECAGELADLLMRFSGVWITPSRVVDEI
jgi:hypothetical protein